MNILEKARGAAQLVLPLVLNWSRVQVQGFTGRENRGATVSFWEVVNVIQTVSPAEGFEGEGRT